ncbi:MAG: hypothetical protein B7X02_00175 [Rhodospirillales bacterium 12-54-5]|nr:MAG: hypothetical protein B7X02_00175 [Rhodospirillales bacterium 12-54-5]
MLVDDSAVVRGMLQSALKGEASILVAATAVDGQMALDILKRTPVDIIILDIEMPVMDGLTALPLLLALAPKVKIIMASTLTLRNAEISIRALELGATDYLAKPSASEAASVADFYRQLIEKIKALGGSASASRPSTAAAAPKTTATSAPVAGVMRGVITDLPEALRMIPRAEAIALASSTGGPQALLAVFTALKGKIANTPIFVTQHMPPNFTTILATHISNAVGVDCHEAKSGEIVKPGGIYLAPGDFHMTVERQAGVPTLRLDQNPQENFCRPAADPMLRSLASVYGSKLFVAVLTGMGSDGAKGAEAVAAAGGYVIAQDEASCIVYGMPKAVADAKLAKAILPLNQIAPCVARAMGA